MKVCGKGNTARAILGHFSLEHTEEHADANTDDNDDSNYDSNFFSNDE